MRNVIFLLLATKLINFWFRNLIFISITFFLFSGQLYSEVNLKELTLSAFQSKQYKKSARLSLQYLKSIEKIEVNDPVLNIYFQVESDLSRLDFYLEKFYRKGEENPIRIYKFMYYLLEKAYIAKDTYLSKKWGDIFFQEAGRSKKYARGVFVYAGLLYLSEEKEKAKKILNKSPEKKWKGSSKLRFQILKMSLYKKEGKVIKSSKEFLSSQYNANYADFVLAVLIQSYINIGDTNSALEWKRKLDTDFPNSVFRENFSLLN